MAARPAVAAVTAVLALPRPADGAGTVEWTTTLQTIAYLRAEVRPPDPALGPPGRRLR